MFQDSYEIISIILFIYMKWRSERARKLSSRNQNIGIKTSIINSVLASFRAVSGQEVGRIDMGACVSSILVRVLQRNGIDYVGNLLYQS